VYNLFSSPLLPISNSSVCARISRELKNTFLKKINKMHEEATITTTAASSKGACNVINNNSHQSITIDNNNSTSPTATTISIVHLHPHHHSNATIIDNYTPSSSSSSSTNATTLAIPTSNLTSQIVSPQTKIIISSNVVDDVVNDHHVECNDVSSVILNGADPNVLIVGTNSSCDKNELTLNISNDVQQQQQMEIEIVESAVIATVTSDDGGIEGGSGSLDESDAGEGEFNCQIDK
jgi:hypothetical protein